MRTGSDVHHVTMSVKLMYLRAFVTLLCFAGHTSASGGIFGEGYSSSLPGGPSALSFRAFTIYTAEEACETSSIPAKLKIFPNPIQMGVGDRIHRSNVKQRPSELVVEAYDEHGVFLPAVPINVSILDTNNVITSRSDWDYFEATKEGEAEVFVSWACSTADSSTAEAHAQIYVSTSRAKGRSD